MFTFMNIRPATPGDLESVHRLEEQLFAHGSYPYFFFRQALDALPAFFLVAEAEGQVVGYVLGSVQSGEEHGWVLSLGVSPDAQGRGVGGVLTVELLEELAKRGAKEAFLHVAPSNTAAISLYEKRGFAVVRSVENYFGPGAHRLIMRREL